MKKFYSTALAALCALGVSATINVGAIRTEVPVRTRPVEKAVEVSAIKTSDLTLSSESNILPKFDTAVKKSKKTIAAQTIKFEKVANGNSGTAKAYSIGFESVSKLEKVVPEVNHTPKKVTPLAEGEDDEEDYSSIAGEYTIFIGDYYRGTNSQGSIEERATITQDGAQITITSDYFIPVTAAYDEETGEITFSQQKLGEKDFQGGNKYYVRFDPYYYDEAKKDLVISTFKANYNTEDGSIEFPSGYGFSWRLFKDSRYTSGIGTNSSDPSYQNIFDVEGMERYTGKIDLTKIAGEYKIYIGDYYFSDSTFKTLEKRAKISQDGEEIVITCDYFQTPVYAAYDEGTGKITFSQVPFGEVPLQGGGSCYIAFDPFHWDEEAKECVVADFEATYNFNDGSISFPVDHGFSWHGYEDDQYTVLSGNFDIFDVEGMERAGIGVVDLTKIAGDYIIKIGDYYRGEQSEGSIEKRATIKQNEGEIVITCDYFQTPVYAAYDEETGKITFSQVPFGEVPLQGGGSCYIAFDPFHWDEEAKECVVADFEATYNVNDGSISFPVDHGFSWYGYEDDQYTVLKGPFDIFDVEGMVRDNASSEEPDPDPEVWETFGTGLFYNEMASVFADNVTHAPYEVKVYQGTTNPNLYKVEDAWKELYTVLNFDVESPSFELDATDPNNVLLPLAQLGLAHKTDGAYLIFNYGYLAYINGVTPPAFTTLTVEDNVLTFTFEPKSLILATQNGGPLGYINDVANTLIVTKEDNGDAGIKDVTTVDENAPVEYFNLQGVRIDNPAAGQVVIKRQGTAVSKVFVR